MGAAPAGAGCHPVTPAPRGGADRMSGPDFGFTEPHPAVTQIGIPCWRVLPVSLAALRDLALDLRWTWSHRADALWERIDAELWQRTRNPWTMLEDIPAARLAELAADPRFIAQLDAPGRGAPRLSGDAGLVHRNLRHRRARRGGVLLHGVRPGRCVAALCRRARRAGGRPAEDRERSRRSGDRHRPAVPGRLFPADDRRRRLAAGCLSLQRAGDDAGRAGAGPHRRVAAHHRRAAGADAAPAGLARHGRADRAVSAGQQRSAEQPGRPLHHRQAVRRRNRTAADAGDRPRRRRLAARRGGASRDRGVPPERGPRRVRGAGTRAQPRLPPGDRVRGGVVGDPRRQHLHHPHAGFRRVRPVPDRPARPVPPCGHGAACRCHRAHRARC